MKPVRVRPDVKARPYFGLFLLLAELRAANAESLHTLFFAPQKIPFRTMMRRLADLVAARYLSRARLRGSRSIYHLTAKSLEMVSTRRLGASEMLRRRPRGRQAEHCWLRGCYRAALKKDGFTVGRSNDEILELRRHLIDQAVARVGQAKEAFEQMRLETALHLLRTHKHLLPIFRDVCDHCQWQGRLSKPSVACERCKNPTRRKIARDVLKCRSCGAFRDRIGRHEDRRKKGAECNGRLRVVDALPFDVAWRKRDGRRELVILFIDNPSRPLKAQLAELPLGIDGQPLVSIIVRSVDPDSRIDPTGKGWLSIGPRHRALLRAFQKRKVEDRDEEEDSDLDQHDHLGATANVIDPYPALHVHA